MNKSFFKSAFLWGFMLWLIGYLLSIIFFPFIPNTLLGWIIMPIGLLITLAVLIKKIHATSFQQYLLLAVIWTTIAVILDYILIVKLINPPKGYYKLDIYIYYAITFLLPLLVAWKKLL